MKDILIRWFTAFNAFLIRATGGRIGGRLGTQTILLLQTSGRKTGQPRVIPVAYFQHEGNYLLVGLQLGEGSARRLVFEPVEAATGNDPS